MAKNKFETIPGIGRINSVTLELHVETSTNHKWLRKAAQDIANAALGTVTVKLNGMTIDTVDPSRREDLVMINPTQLKDLVAADNVQINAVFDKARKPKSGMPNNWRVTLTRAGRQLSTDFHGGAAVTATPTATTVLTSLLLDASFGEFGFEDYCAETGEDPDSRTALACYTACCRTRVKLVKFLGDAFGPYSLAQPE